MAMDAHRHDEFSSFDGFGKALDLARLAKKKGLTALGLTNHGNMNGIIEHYIACKQEGVKPILGVEAYFQPKFNKKNPSPVSYHLCLFAKTLDGYKNINRIMSYAFLKQKYKKPIVDFPLLRKYSKDVIATSGCIASFISQAIIKDKYEIAKKAIDEFVDIFGKDNFYIEIQPYKISEKGVQEKVNVWLVKYAVKNKMKMILTSDSHYGDEEDYPTYMKMHEIKSSDDFAGDTYEERYMPAAGELEKRFIKMHKRDFPKTYKKIVEKFKKDMQEFEDKIDGEMLDKLELELPKVSDNSSEQLWNNIVEGLKKKGKYKKEYVKRCKEEYEVIKYHGFEDYFLIVQDYVLWAKNRGIKVGPGRGSVCDSLVAYALDITDVDSLYFNLDFRRFLRKDKKKLPDVDIDFEPERRDEVIQYIINKYKGHAAQICSYGLYKVDNLLNDLFKVCGLDEKVEGLTDYEIREIKQTQKDIKQWVKKNVIDEEFHYESVQHDPKCREWNRKYDNIILHFSKMFKKVRYIGTHAAGVAVVGGNLLDYTSLQTFGNKEKGTWKILTAYDLNNLETINVVKFDILGLRTLNVTKELEQLTNDCFSYKWLEDEKIYEYFKEGKTDGIFQFEKDTAKEIMRKIQVENVNDVIAVNALNRPGPLSLKMPEQYAENKFSGDYEGNIWAEYTKDSYGTIIYQEQIMSICTEIGLMSMSDADKVLKFMKGTNMTERALREKEREEKRLRSLFIEGAQKSVGLTKEEANSLFESLIVYSFNKGHATGYGLISIQQMYYKVKYPELFWYVTLKYAANDSDLFRLKVEAIKEGNIILLPHVNFGAMYSIVKIDGERAIAEGLQNIKGVGPKAAIAIEEERKKNGRFKNKEDFLKRMSYPRTPVNKGVIKALEESGALLFDKKTYFNRVQKYNAHLYSMSLK